MTLSVFLNMIQPPATADRLLRAQSVLQQLDDMRAICNMKLCRKLKKSNQLVLFFSQLFILDEFE